MELGSGKEYGRIHTKLQFGRERQCCPVMRRLESESTGGGGTEWFVFRIPYVRTKDFGASDDGAVFIGYW